MPTLLHISDLHRTSGPRVHNDNLLAAMASDAGRWADEGIPRPDIVVVSGDLIQGARFDDPAHEDEVARQYAEAADLLRRLADEFVDGDRHRVVIVPGNHDVSWPRAHTSMAPLDPCPPDIRTQSMDPDSLTRWDWSSQQALTVVDVPLYDSRFEAYRRFRDEFYEDVAPSPSVADPDLVFFNYPELGLALVGFASWHGNDCCCFVGEIHPRLVALSRELLRETSAPTAVAVWHHSLVGGPRMHDYMDERVVHQLIDYGFSLGLHGHQHFPAASPYELRLPNLTSMAVVSAGSLSVGDDDLPMGERRQFNLVVLDPEKESVTIHVRAMSPSGVFMGSHRDDFGGNTFIDLPLKHSPSRPLPPTPIRRLDDAIAAGATGDHELALRLARELGPAQDPGRRQVTIAALDNLGREDELLDVLTPPQSADEVARLVAILISRRDFERALQAVAAAGAVIDGSLARELQERIEAERAITS